MTLPPPRDHHIPVQEAKAMARRYRASVSRETFRAGYYPAEAFTAILNQRGCRGIRIYLGRHEDGTLNLILVGVNKYGRDMLKGRRVVSAEGAGEDEEGEPMQNSYPCPTYCDDGSPMNDDE